MPSPIGHALGGIAAGLAAAAAPPRGRAGASRAATLAFAALRHGRRPRPAARPASRADPQRRRHARRRRGGLGGARRSTVQPAASALAAAAAYGSHVLLDWLGSDTSPPIGPPGALAVLERLLPVAVATSSWPSRAASISRSCSGCRTSWRSAASWGSWCRSSRWCISPEPQRRSRSWEQELEVRRRSQTCSWQLDAGSGAGRCELSAQRQRAAPADS